MRRSPPAKAEAPAVEPLTEKVADQLGKAVERHHQKPTIPNFDGKLSFDAMRERCRAVGDQIEVGHWEGEAGLLQLNLIEAEKKQWKWRDPKTNKGVIAPENWLSGKRWLDIVKSKVPRS